MFLLICSRLLILYRSVGEIFLLQFLGNPIIELLLLIVKSTKLDLYKYWATFVWTSLLFLSAKILISPSLTAWWRYSSISFEFCLSWISRSSPFSRFIKALAYCWDWPCIRNILLWSVYFIYFASFSFSTFFSSAFFYSFFLYSLIDLAFASANLCLYRSASSFFFFLSSSFCLASSSRAAIIIFFFPLIESLNSYFFFIFDSLLRSYSSFCYFFTSLSFCCSWSSVISSSSPKETKSISCFGRALIFFYNSLI